MRMEREKKSDGLERGKKQILGEKNLSKKSDFGLGGGWVWGGWQFCPAPPHPAWVFPTSQKRWGGDGAIFCPRTSRRGRDGFSIFIPAPPRPRPALIRTIFVNLVNSKSLIFKVKHKTLDKIFFILNLLLLLLTLLPSL